MIVGVLSTVKKQIKTGVGWFAVGWLGLTRKHFFQGCLRFLADFVGVPMVIKHCITEFNENEVHAITRH